ncbi:sodium:solute symporter [Planctomycetaceae bacterium SH139]
MNNYFTWLDWLVLVAYFAAIMGLGIGFHRRNRSSEDFTVGGRALSGWLCGLSIFATYLSSISYLALPGSSFVSNWNAFVFSLTLPVAAWIATVWFLPYYRRTQEISAYAMLERRFGPWARIFASEFYLLYQIARMGVVMYLMALPMTVIFGWDIRLVILATGVVVTVYAFVGGIIAVIWADAIQAVVLMIGAIVALGVILWGVPSGLSGVLELGTANQKFSWGETKLWEFSEKTVWVMFAYGVMENIKNFGIDQSYIQRYIASRDDREARRSVWLGGLLYIPVSGLFFFIGSSLFAFYESRPAELTEVRQIVARQQLMQAGTPPQYAMQSSGELRLTAAYASQVAERAEKLPPEAIGDRVFPHFIAAHLPMGMTGLLVAAIFAAAMSTVSTSLNSSATLIMSDFRRFIRPEANDRNLMRCLYGATVVWGIAGTVMALALVPLTENVLTIWWTLSSVLGAGIVGLFLLGLISRRATSFDAQIAFALGMLVVGWMAASQTDYWPSDWSAWQSPFHSYLVIVVGPATILGTGIALALRHDAPTQRTENP